MIEGRNSTITYTNLNGDAFTIPLGEQLTFECDPPPPGYSPGVLSGSFTFRVERMWIRTRRPVKKAFARRRRRATVSPA